MSIEQEQEERRQYLRQELAASIKRAQDKVEDLQRLAAGWGAGESVEDDLAKAWRSLGNAWLYLKAGIAHGDQERQPR